MGILELLGGIGDVLDTPGRFVRTGLSGRNPFASIFDPEQGASGRDMLESWGVLDPNQEGLDVGDAVGFGAELLTDPMNLLGAGLLGKTARAASFASKSNAASDVIQRQNYLIDLARNKAREADDWNVAPPSRRAADMVIDVSQPKPGLREAFPSLDEEGLMDLSYGTRDKAAGAALRSMGLDDTVLPAHPAAQAIGERAGVKAYAMPENGETLGAIIGARPDMMFVTNQPLPTTLGTTGHELVHTLARKYPNEYQAMEVMLGKSAIDNSTNQYFGGDDLRRLMFMLNRGQRGGVEEGIAEIFGNVAKRGALKQRYPLVDQIHVGVDGPVEAMADQLRTLYPDAIDPRAASQLMLDYVSGNMAKGYALAPSGPLVDSSPVRSFSGAPRLTDGEQALAGAPYSAFPPHNSVPRIGPLLSMLGGYNAAMLPERGN